MARARNLKPGFFNDAELVECEFWVRLLFAGLWTLADREGRLLDRPKQIGVDLFPRDAVDAEAGLASLADHGLIVRYEVDGQHIIQVKNFCHHQNPHRDERASTLPPLPSKEEHDASTVEAPCEHGGNRADSGLPVTDSGLLDVSASPLVRSHGPYTDEFEKFWKLYPPVTNNSKKKAFAAWQRLKPEQREAAMECLPGYLASEGWPRYAPHTATFLNGALWQVVPVPRASPNGTTPRQQTPEEIAEFKAWMRENQPA